MTPRDRELADEFVLASRDASCASGDVHARNTVAGMFYDKWAVVGKLLYQSGKLYYFLHGAAVHDPDSSFTKTPIRLSLWQRWRVAGAASTIAYRGQEAREKAEEQRRQSLLYPAPKLGLAVPAKAGYEPE